MTFPVGVDTIEVTTNPSTDMFGDTATVEVTVTPYLGEGAFGIRWDATGEPLNARPRTYKARGGAAVTFAVPVTDQAGWIDGEGNAFTGWAYKAVTIVYGPDGRTARVRREQMFQPVSADGATFDLDEVPDGVPGSVTLPAVQVPVPGPPGPALPEEQMAELNAAFVKGAARAGAGSYTTGNVILIGDHAYAPAGIATAAVMGGATNYENVIGGNTANVDTSTSNLTGAPALTGENGNWNYLLGGYDTVVNGWANFVIGNHIKVEADANHATISGGSRHTINAGGDYAAVGGGTGHVVSGEYCTVSGGRLHTIGGALGYSTIGGGHLNTSNNEYTTVGGGKSNTASEANATVAGGNTNTASANSSTVGGGLTNTASGTGATVPGGRDNTASGDYSTALGRYSTSTGTHSVSTGQGGKAERIAEHAVGNRFAVAGDAQASVIVLRRQTTDATASTLSDGATAAPTMTALSTVAFRGLVVARRTDAEGEHASFEIKGAMARQSSSTILVGTPTVTSLGFTSGAGLWTVAVTATSGRLTITVTGEAAKTIRWVCRLETAQVTP